MALADRSARPFSGHAGQVLAVAFAPDGATIATGGVDRTVRIWDTRTGAELRQLTGHTGEVHAVAFSPDGAMIATGSSDLTARVWYARNGEELRQLTGHTDPVLTVAFSPDGAMIATGSSDGTARIWDARTGAELRQLTGHIDWVRSVAFAPDGATIVTTSRDSAARIWDARSGAELRQLTGHTGAIWSVAFAPDGAAIATTGSDGTARIWDARSGAELRQLTGHTGVVWSVAFAPDGATIATASRDGTARIWDARTGAELRQLTGHTDLILTVTFAPDGASIATASGDGTARIWETRTGSELRQLSGHTGQLRSVAFAPDSATIATAGDDRTARIWDTRTGAELRHLAGHTGQVRSVAFAPDGATIATASEDGTARVWDTRTGAELRQLTGHTSWVTSVAFAPDGATIATTGSDNRADTTRIWDARSGVELRQLTGHTGAIWSVAFAPDGAAIATTGSDGTARVWDTRTGAELRHLAGHTEAVWSVVFAPDGASIATASSDGTVRVWDTRTGAELRQLTGHTGRVRSVAFAPDSATIATAGDDRTARIWDTRTGAELRQLTGHTGEVNAVAFAPDGATIATVSADSTIRIWNTRNGQQVDGTGFGAPRRVGRPLAGVRSDAPSARDEIAATADAETLADLIAASETAPPLAIALIGDWGAGKSSVMLQVQRRIDMLAELSRNNPGLSVFAANVRQVRFNAWDYSDDQVWSGLVDHLFRELAADPADQSTSPSPAEVQARRTAIQEDIAARQAEAQRLADRLSAADNAARPGGSLGWLGSPAGAARIVLISGGLVLRDVRKNPWILLFWAILVAGAYGAWLAWGPRIGAVAAVLAPVVAIGQRLLSWHRRGTGAVLALRSRLDKRQQEIAQELTGLRERLALVDASARLSAFLSDRAAPAAYQRYRGLLGQVRADLTRLADDLTAAHREWAASGAVSPPPLERIVLYIDDLDRCPPRRVVEVLEAVHLMLALDLFVVVVAVDARWLIRSMEYHYRELFGPDTKSGTVNSVEAATSPDPASPVDYLDKIFQIPYVLAPSPPAAVASYLQSLLPAPAAPPAAAPEAASSGYSGTEAASDGTAAAAADPQIDGAGHAPAAVAPEAADRPEPSPPEPEPSPPERDRAERGDRLTGTKDPAASRADSQETAAAAATPDLRPRGLQVSQPEVEFLGRLGPVLPTPRAAKRLVNLYRLVRISIPEADLAAFAGTGDGQSEYQFVQILLAILVGSPAMAQWVFKEIMAAPADTDIRTVLRNIATADGGAGAYTRISAVLDQAVTDVSLRTEAAAYQSWCPRLARYSFHTRELAAAHSGPGS